MSYKIITPTVTVFDNNGGIDIEGNKEVINFLIEGGVDGLAPLGSTGEFTNLSMEDKKKLFKLYVDEVAGRVEIIAGTSSMIYEEVVELSNYALEIGSDAVMVLPPYYFAIDQEEAYIWFDNLAKDINGDIYIYNFEARSGFNIAPQTLARLAEKHKNIVGIKDSTLNASNTKNLIYAAIKVRPDFKIYSGFDNQFVTNIMAGGSGNISALSNFAPQLWANWIKAAKDGNWDEVMKYQRKFDALMPLYDVQSNFSLLFKKFLKEDGLNINTKSIFPFNQISEEDYSYANHLRKNI